MKRFLTFLLLTTSAFATTRTVKTSGGDFTNPVTCINASSPGDICEMYTGSFTGGTVTVSGSAGNVITLQKATGQSPTVTSTITVSSRSYLTFSNLAFTAGITGNGSTQHITIDSNTFTGNVTAWRINDGLGANGSNNVFSNNTITFSSIASSTVMVYVFGDNNRFENNTFTGGGGDCMELGGTNLVVRGNFCHGQSGATSSEHIDFVQGIGGASPVISFSLFENNVIQANVNQAHCIIIRTLASGVADGNIFRYNFCQNLDSSGGNFGGSGDTVPDNKFYNNTIALEHKIAENGDWASWQNANTGSSFNNIYYNSEADSWSPIIAAGTTGFTANADITYNSVGPYTGSWNSPYSAEATYATLKNQNPVFANYPTDGTLSAGSPAIGAGVKLTSAVGAGTASTSLTVGDSYFFQSGWAGTNADWIRIGASTTVQISSINNGTNVITLASAATWSNGDPVYMYKNSSGTVVLNGSAPDIGAYPFSSGAVATPTFSPVAGTYTGTQSVTISTSTSGATLCYTTDGTTPTANGAGTCTHGTTYSSAVSVAASETLKAIGSKSSFTDSGIGSAAYVIQNPAVGLSPTSITFASTTINTNSANSVVTLTNTGTATLNITSETITVDTTDFTKVSTTCGATLAASGTCTVTVRFNPTTIGAKTANLTFVTDAATSPDNVALSGTGTSLPTVQLSPSSLTYSAQVVNTTSSGQIVTLTNGGTQTLTITSIALVTGTNYAISANNCSGTLAGGGNCIVTITFTPTTTGTLTDTLRFTTNAASSPDNLAITGTGQSGSVPTGIGTSKGLFL